MNMDRIPRGEEGRWEALGQWEAAVHQNMQWRESASAQWGGNVMSYS